MTGVKGKSGGPRDMKGKSGGTRPGAGRKRQPPATAPVAASADNEPTTMPGDPLDFLLQVMNGRINANATQVRAAVAAVQYVHHKKGEGGKRAGQVADAKKQAGAGRFKPTSPPLSLVQKRQAGGNSN